MNFRNRTFHPVGFPAGRISAWIALGLLWIFVAPIASSGAQLSLSWSDNSNNESGFKIERSLDGQSFSQIATVAANVETYANTGLAESTSYWFRVRAYNSAGNSGYSNVGSAQTPGSEEPPPPPPPGNTAPTITSIPNQTINEDGTTGSIAFKVTDAESTNSSLTLSATSSNATLIPLSGISFGGASTDRTIQVSPASNRSGAATVTVTVSDGLLTASRTFQVTVYSVNDTPGLETIPDQTIDQGGNTGAIAFRILDVETASNDLVLTRTSSNTGLIPLSGIVFGGNGTNRTVTVTPVASQSGIADITVLVSDGQATGSRSFSVTVLAESPPPPPPPPSGNTAPTITAIPNQTINEDGTTGAIAFKVTDTESTNSSLTLTAISSNATLIPLSGISFGGASTDRTVQASPASNRSGAATVTITVSDGHLVDSETFQITVNPVNDSPTLSNIPNKTISQGGNTGPIGFSVDDQETQAGNLVVSADSSNLTLVPLSGISFGGSGQNRSISISPAPNQSGETTITVRVSDGQLDTTDTLRLTVNPLGAVAVSLAAPLDGAQFGVGSDINMTALVSDSARTSRVEFFSGSTKLGQDSNSPYSFTWPSPDAGSYTLKARVVETSGVLRDSSPAGITVTQVIQLTVSMVSPSADESMVLGESMALEAVVTGPGSAIKRVDFYVDATRIKQEFYPPYTATWVPEGTGIYALTARVISTTNSSSDSPVRTVSVAPVAVTVSLISPDDQASFGFGEAIAMEALVSDIAETQRVDFYDGNNKIKSEYYSPYAFNWTPETSGVHSIWARVHDTAGNTRISDTAEIAVESPPDPLVVLEAPNTGSSFVIGQEITLRASVEASGRVIDRVEFYRGTTKLGQDSSAPFALDWTATPVGSHDLKAKVISSDGMEFGSRIVRVVVLTDSVTVSLTEPVDGQTLEVGESIALAASVSDEDRTDRVEFYAEDMKIGEDSSAPYTLGWTPSESGSQSVYARVIEKGGGSRDSSVAVITVEGSFPVKITITSPAEGTVIRIGELVTVSAEVDVSSDSVERVEFNAGSERIKTDFSAPYEFVWTPTATGNYSLRANALNIEGTRYTSDRVVLVVKHLPVLAELTKPANGAVFAFGQTVKVRASVSDLERTDRVEFEIDGNALSEDFEAPFEFAWSKPASGNHEIRVRVVDLDGDSYVSEPISISIEDPPLTVTLVSPANGVRISKGGRLTIEATTSDADRTSKVEFLDDGVVVNAVSDAPFNFVWTGEEVGPQIIQARAYNTDGNESLSKRAVIVVNPPLGPSPGLYRGEFLDSDDTETGAFAIHVDAEGNIAFLGYDESSGTGFLSRSVVLDEDGEFEIDGESPSGAVVLTARIGPDTIEGRVDDLDLVVIGDWVADSNQSSFYRLVGVRSLDTEIYLAIGPGGWAFIGALGGGHFRGHEVVPISTDSGLYVSSTWLGLKITLDRDEGIARGIMNSPGGSIWVAGLAHDVPVEQRLENLSTRGFINPGNSVLIVGFVTSGDAPKQVLIRGVGPGLGDFGLTSAMQDPTLELRAGTEQIATNQRWFTAEDGQRVDDVSTRVGAFPLNRNSADAALLEEVGAGVYSAIVRDALRLGGDTLVEIYDTDEDNPLLADLIGLSTRGSVAAGKNLIGGFVISGNMPKRILIRGVGPALAEFGVTNALESVRLVLTQRVAGDEVTIGDNLGWSSNPQASVIAEITAAVGAFSLEPEGLDSALLLWLEPGVYTFIVQPGAVGQAGTALVEVYSVP